jgi:hypothetical protein
VTISQCVLPCAHTSAGVATYTTAQWTVVERIYKDSAAAAFGPPRWRYDTAHHAVTTTFMVTRGGGPHFLVAVTLHDVAETHEAAAKDEVRAMLDHPGQWSSNGVEGFSN